MLAVPKVSVPMQIEAYLERHDVNARLMVKCLASCRLTRAVDCDAPLFFPLLWPHPIQQTLATSNYTQYLTLKVARCYLGRSNGRPLSLWIHVHKPATTLFFRTLQVHFQAGPEGDGALGLFNLGNRETSPWF